ncbi:cell shape-determining protein MreC [Marmoricola sp. URHA0025 HA25]
MRNPLQTVRDNGSRIRVLEEQVAELMDSVEENRRLNERLSDVLDVVTELLVPAVDRDDARVREALEKLQGGRWKAT